MNEKIESKLKLLPDKPGVYKMFNARGELIYVGKAINLKNRVRQYFQSSKNHTPKVASMVTNIDDFDFVIVGNETRHSISKATSSSRINRITTYF